MATQNPLHGTADSHGMSMIELGDSPARSAAAGHAGATTTPADATADGSQYDDTPFPCVHPGCRVFHSDFNTGYCPLHGQGYGSGGAVTRWVTPSRKTSMRLQYASKAAVIVSVTAVMAVMVMEANDKSILLLLAYSAVGS